MFPKRKKPARMGIRQPEQIRSASHLKFVRGFVCIAFGHGNHVCDGKTEAHHVRTGTNGGTGMKPGDDFTIPLCTAAHRELHDGGETSFAILHGLDLLAHAARLWRISPHRAKAEAKP